jgi:Domain of unknown function (DUF4394)/Calx-beta domain
MRLTKRFKLTMAAGLAVTGLAVAAAPSYAAHQTVTGLTNESPSRIVQFAVGTPGTLINGTPSQITFPAGATDTDLVGLDYRPRGNTLFAMGSGGTLYTLSPPATPPGNFTATRVNTPAMNPFTGTPTSFGFDFNPTVDRIRVVNNSDGGAIADGNYNNYRFNPDNGAQVDGNHGQAAEPPPFPPGVQADGDLNYANMSTPSIVASAYTNNFDGATTTTLFGIDSQTDNLTVQNPPNLGTQNVVGPLGVNTTELAGFDIEAGTGTAYAALQPMGDAESSFYRVDLTVAAALPPTSNPNQIGPDGTPPLESISLVPTSVLRFPNAVTSVAENGGSATVNVVREGPLNRTTTVNYATEIADGDTASAGDFTATSGTLTFAAGDATESFTVPITDDAADEPAETFTVRLSMPNVASNLQMPPTAQVQIIDDEATPGALTPLVNVPEQSLKQVLDRREVRYRYSCNVACDEATSLRLKGTELGRNRSSLDGQGSSKQDVRLGKDARRALRTAPGSGDVKVKLISTFTDRNQNETRIVTRFSLAR